MHIGVREWRAMLLANGMSVPVTAKAYRLLCAILATAIDTHELHARTRRSAATTRTQPSGWS